MTGKKCILALDLGTTTGWSCRTADGRIYAGSGSFKPGKYEGGGMRYVRFVSFLNETRDVHGDIGAVYFEAVRRHNGTDAAHVYGGLMGTLTAWCELRGIPYAGVPVGTIKKFWTGKGTASKDGMMAEAKRRGYVCLNDNEADALALLHWALENAP